MKRLMLTPLVAAMLLALPLQVWAEGADEAEATLFPVPDYSGDWLSRPRLSGDWGGHRQSLADRGVQLEVDFVQTLQGVVDGGIDEGIEYTGSLEYVLKIDIEKLGLWPGAFMLVRGETLFGDAVNGQTGSQMASNTDALFPVPGEDRSTLTDLNIVQFLHPKAGIVLGKISTLDGDANEFAHGRGTDQFLNMALNLNPVTLRTVPYSALGAGLMLVPTEDIVLQLSALDAEGTPQSDGFDTVFEGGTVLAFEGRIATDCFDLPGHQLLGATWSSRNFVSSDQDPRFLLNLLPGVTIPPERVKDSWSVYYNFDQYLWQPEGDSQRGIGIFGRLGFADEDASPIRWFVSFGVGGKGALPGRREDSFGLGYFIVGASDEFPGFADLDHGQGFEVYYDIAVTPWLHLTPDLQVIDPALRRLDTAVVLGLRSKIEF